MTKRNYLLTMAVLLAFSGGARAQTGKAPVLDSVRETLDSWITNAEKHVVRVAEVMPAEKYSFAPPETGGEFKGVRTFAQQVQHLALAVPPCIDPSTVTTVPATTPTTRTSGTTKITG